MHSEDWESFVVSARTIVHTNRVFAGGYPLLDCHLANTLKGIESVSIDDFIVYLTNVSKKSASLAEHVLTLTQEDLPNPPEIIKLLEIIVEMFSNSEKDTRRLLADFLREILISASCFYLLIYDFIRNYPTLKIKKENIQ